MTSNLDTIEKQITELQEKKKALLDEQRDVRLAEVKAIVHQFGFSATDLGLTTVGRKGLASQKTKLEAKYVNPKDSGQTWHGGRGAKPKWVKEFLEAGGELSAIEIKK